MEIGLHPLQEDVEIVIPLSEVVKFYLKNAPRPLKTIPYPYTDEETSTLGLLSNWGEVA